jgi:hypothetical protein
MHAILQAEQIGFEVFAVAAPRFPIHASRRLFAEAKVRLPQ